MFNRNVFLSILMSAGFIAAPNISFAASFDCSKAGTNIEKIICSTESVSQLDEELSKVYKIGVAREQDKKNISRVAKHLVEIQ